MAEEKVGIEVEIDVDKAKQRLKEIKDQIAELKEQWGTAGKETLDKVLQPLLDEQESLEEQLKNVKEATDNVSKSFKKQASELNDVKDVTEFAGDATKALGVDETALGEAVANTTGFIGKSITFIKKGAAAMDALKGATNGATGAVNKFKAALNGLLKHPILILLAGIAATMAIVYKRFKDFSDANFERRLGVINRQTELLNERLNNQITILNALGAKQSSVTRQQINNLKQLNDRLKQTRDYYQEMWDKLGSDNDLGYMANEYLKGNQKLIEDLSEQEQELVRRYAEAGEEIRRNNLELETMENITLKINNAEERYELTQRKINNNYSKQLNAVNRRRQLTEMQIERLKIEDKYSGDIFDKEEKLYKETQEGLNLEIKKNNDLIDALNERKDTYLKLKGEIMNSGKSVEVVQNELAAVDDKLFDINSEILQIGETNKDLETQIEGNTTKRALDYIERRLIAINRLNELNLEYAERQLKLENTRAFRMAYNPGEESERVEKSIRGVDKTYPLVDYMKNLGNVYEETGAMLKTFTDLLKGNSDFIKGEGYSSIEKLRSAIKNVREELSGAKEGTEEFNSIAARLDMLTAAYEDYMQTSSSLLNTLQGVNIEVFSVTEDRIKGAVDVFESLVPIKDMEKVDTIMNNYISQLKQLGNSYEEVYKSIIYYKETGNESISSLNEEELKLYNELKEMNGAGLTIIYETMQNFQKSAVEYELDLKRIRMTNSQMLSQMYQDYASLGRFVEANGEKVSTRILKMRKAEIDSLTAEKEYYDELLKKNGKYYDTLLAAGLSHTQAEEILAEKRLQVESDLANKKKLINRQYLQTVLNATSDTMNDVQDIIDVAFEDNKQVRGATLMMTTIADAAAAYTSVFAQAPGGVAAKTAQAVIASAAVVARGVASYRNLMKVTKDSGSESLSSTETETPTFTATGVDTTSVARTLIGSRYAGEGHTTQYVLVTDEVTARQKQAQGARRLETI